MGSTRKSAVTASRWLRNRVRRALDTMLDTAAGMDSTVQVEQPELDDTMCSYQACYWLAVPRALRGCRVRPEGTFLDLGCGKGRALYAASWYPFRSVIGVEFDPALAGIARRNMASARGPRRLREVEVLHGDARSVPLPPDLRIVFLFNPFQGELFRTVAERIRAHARKQHGTVLVVYLNPVEEQLLLELGFRRLHTSARLLPTSSRCSVYHYDGAP